MGLISTLFGSGDHTDAYRNGGTVTYGIFGGRKVVNTNREHGTYNVNRRGRASAGTRSTSGRRGKK
jgi:hypothetical protein